MSAPPKPLGGRPLKHDEAMRMRVIRMTDSQWADALYIGTDRIRELITEEANWLRRQKATKRKPKQT